MQRSFVSVAIAGILVFSPSYVHAADAAPGACAALFNLLPGTTAQNVDKSGPVSAEACAAYHELIARYVPGGDSARCIANVKIAGITGLHAPFAIRLAKMLKDADAAVGRIQLNSAYRNACAQGSANPAASAKGFVSMHSKGLAVDLIYPGGGTKHDCSSAGYQWIIANAKNYGIAQYDQVHPRVSGECNHIEDNTGAKGNPIRDLVPQAITPTRQLLDGARQLFGQDEKQPPRAPTPAPASSQPTNAFNPSPSNGGGSVAPGTVNSPAPLPTQTQTPPAVTTLINALAEPSSTPTPAISTNGSPLALNASLTNTSQVVPPRNTNPPIPPYIPVPSGAPSTFTSDDLANSPRQAYAPKPADTFALRTLENLKQVLLKVIAYLRPFGGLGTGGRAQIPLAAE